MGGNLVFQGLKALHSVCNIALEEAGFGGTTVTVNAEGGANTMGIRQLQRCPGRFPTQLRPPDDVIYAM